MKIGIDAKWFFEGPPSGRVVVRQLVENIIKNNDKHQIYLFLNKKNKSDEFPFINEKVNLIYVWGWNDLLSNLFVLRRKAILLKLDVVLFQNFPTLTKKFSSISYIHDVLFLTYPQFFGFKERLYFSPLKFLARKSKLIITISQSEKERLILHKFSTEEKIKVVYHGIGKEYKTKSEFNQDAIEKIYIKYNLPESFLLYVGRLNIRKNIKNLLLAIKRIDNKNIQIAIVGSTDCKMFDIDSFIQLNELKNRVKFLGFVPDNDLPMIYSMATIFCFPSYAEGFGLPILEAMAAGIPVVTSNTSSMPEVAGDAAALVSPDNVQEIANGINTLLSDKDLFESYKNKGIKRSMEFTWEKSAKKIIEYIEQINM